MTGLRLLGRIARAARRAHLGGAFVVVRDAADGVFLAAGRPPLRVTVDDIELRGFLRHRSFLAHLARGDYEVLSREVFREELGRSDVVADVGAHIGFYSLLAARTAPHATVVAFEPDPYNAAALRINVRRAGAHNVRVVERAVTDRVGRATFRQSRATIGSSLVPRVGFGPTRDIQVDTTTLDSELGDLSGRRLLLKLDVEGAERAALGGASGSLTGAAAVTAIVEVNPRALEQAGTTPHELIADLEAFGLSLRYVDEAANRLRALDSEPEKGNLVGERGR
jgi:FkbM family methyltransferase